ncbi:hypothetical protein [Streptomyces sp. NPDC006267]|uniref:hypothetical protein n=1 Tax=Streptomyces sp. NPDC006267 TaxID=3157173 RepID=UPI0033B56408
MIKKTTTLITLVTAALILPVASACADERPTPHQPILLTPTFNLVLPEPDAPYIPTPGW